MDGGFDPGPRRRAHLVLSSGGIRCLSYVGALKELRRGGWEFASVSTCSAGTLIGALLGAGVSPEQMAEAAESTDLASLGGRVGMARQVWRLRQQPFAIYPESRVPGLFDEIVGRFERRSIRTLGQLDPPLATAAVDLRSGRILVYSSAEHPDMEIAELLQVATAVPLVYPPVQRQAGELVDAAIAWKVPVWLAAGFKEPLATIVLRPDDRTYAPKRTWRSRLVPRWVPWITGVVGSGIDSRDGVLLDATPRLRLYDIPTSVGPFDFRLRRDEVRELIRDGEAAVADYEERSDEQAIRALESRAVQPVSERDLFARADALRRYDEHLRQQVPTVFISYAREDRPWVERIRRELHEILKDDTVSVWDDSYIASGDEFNSAIIAAISRSRVIIVLVSRSSAASEFIRQTELPLLCDRARRGESTLLWVSLDGAPAPPVLQDTYDAIGDPAMSLENDDAAAGEAMAAMAREVERALNLSATFKT